MPAADPNTRAHLEWLGFIQPHGLVVSPPALLKAGAFVNRQDTHRQALLAGCAEERELAPDRPPTACIRDFREFAAAVLGWGFSPRGYAGFTAETPIPEELTLPLPDYGETLRPDFAVRERDPGNGDSPWQLLVQVLAAGQEFDRPAPGAGGLDASAQGRAERLLRATGVRAGVLVNGVALRLISAPHGESSGWMDFRFADLLTTAGRPLCSALHLLLSEQRLLALPRHERLTALLAGSRLYQNEVSERLAEQVLHALYELVRGFQNAHAATDGALLSEPLAAGGDRNAIYRGLLTVILRLVFLLYAEERGLLPKDETFARHYLLGGLYRRLRKDAAAYPDTMDQRYGAWAQLVVLFRLLHDGIPAGRGGAVSLPERRGALFDPDRYRFLEGRSGSGSRQRHARLEPPRVSDGVVYRVLEKLLVLDGERLSYRTLDVEQIGSVYETIMGFRLETATGRSLAVKPAKKLGAPTTIDLDALLAQPAERRGRWLQERADRPVSAGVAKGLRAAETVNDLHAALDRVLDHAATPDLVPRGGLVLQPNEERRRSGSHYTPRELTEPIVRHTLAPLLERLRGEDGGAPRPEQVLDLKICDPAMGSGAFLVETCRQLADALIEAWGAHGATPDIPPDEDEVTFARRLVAQKCLYGIDRNPMAVDLAKVSLWLSTLARDHPFTFVDHAFRRGDSLLGLTRRQLEALHWQGGQPILAGFGVREAMEQAAALRRRIREADDTVTDRQLRTLWRAARDVLTEVRRFGDLTLAAFFEGSKPKERAARREAYHQAILNRQSQRHAAELAARRNAEVPFAPFHWEIEFPEVFERANPGFDGFVGNPPFLGGKRISTTLGTPYRDWLSFLHIESNSNTDIVAHFFRRAFNLIRKDGAFGLIATNTISQGDTRSGGLRWIGNNGGEIYRARRRVKWPGVAAVVVSVVHATKGAFYGTKYLDDQRADTITAFLFHKGGHDDPVRLVANEGKSFVGSFVRGMGFTFDDTDRNGVASKLSVMRKLVDNPLNSKVISPYIGGEEVNKSPTHAYHRYVINFRDWPLLRDTNGELWATADEERRRALRRKSIVPRDYPEPVATDWPEVLSVVTEKAKPGRERLGNSTIDRAHRERWWRFANDRPQLYAAIKGLDRILVVSRVSQHTAFTFLPKDVVYAETLIVFPSTSYAALCALQSRPHEIWARFFGSTLGDGLRYTPSDCFDTFPFPEGWDTDPTLEAAGKAYYEYRAALMVDNDEGMTSIYNRFHDFYETDPRISKLRELHAAMDRAVLDAYGWSDIPTACDLLLDYEIDEAAWGRKKKPYRWRWPDEVRDEVLARLLALNADRAAAEARAGTALAPGSQLSECRFTNSQRLLTVGEQQSS